MAANLLTSVHFFVAPIVVGVLRLPLGLPNYVVLSRRKMTSRRKKQTTFISQGRSTVLYP